MSPGKVAVIMGSDSDLPVARKVVETLERFAVPCEVGVMSAHRSPEKAWDFAVSAADKGFAVIIAVAGGAAALPGFVASASTLPVIAVPVPTELAGGLDSLLCAVQMPGGVPVLSVGANPGGAANAAVAAVRILALSDVALRDKLAQYRSELASSVDGKDAKVKSEFAKR
jgi:5-(carboxyamino)imidazole ribonucleotide mutase